MTRSCVMVMMSAEFRPINCTMVPDAGGTVYHIIPIHLHEDPGVLQAFVQPLCRVQGR
jgi:hypothetical protein